ncbi:MAG: superoxide dismutase family protein [Gemmatimonadaceae bacterium]
MHHSIRIVAAALLIGACSSPAPQAAPAPTAAPPAAAPVVRRAARSAASFRTATATLRDAAGVRVGTATFTDSYAGLIVAGSVEGLGIGAHGIHIHETGRCEAPFATAGGHFNPTKKHHGFKNAEGPHMGDMPNIDVPASGTLRFEFLLPDVSLRGPNALLDADGAAIVVHATRDDYLTDPAGNSGARLACGVINAN